MSSSKVLLSFILVLLLFTFNAPAVAIEINQPKGKQLTAQQFLNEASRLLNSGKISYAIAYIDSAYRKLQSPSNLEQWQKHNFKADLYLHYRQSIPHAKLQIDSMHLCLINKPTKYPYQYVTTLFNEGDLYFLSGLHAAASEKYYQGITFAKKHLDVCQLSDFSKRLADFKYRQGKFLEAIPYFKHAAAQILMCKEGNDFIRQFVYYQANLNTVALCFERGNKPDSAIWYYQKTLAFIKSKKNSYPDKQVDILIAEAIVEGNLGGVYANVGQDSLAESLLKKSIAINYRPGFLLPDAHSSLLKLARLYLKQKNLREAKATLDQIGNDIANGDKEGNEVTKSTELKWYLLSWQLSELREDFKNANAFQTKYHQLKDSLDNRDLTANNLETNFKAIQNSYELSMLQKNNTLNSLYLWGATLFSVMLIIILVLIIRHLDRSKKNIASLKEFNETIKARNNQLQLTLAELEESRDENTRIMKTVYHDLRGPIGGITMAAGLMLEDPHHSADDEEMLAMIQTSGQDAISLINDMLQITSAVEINKQPVYLPSMLEFCANIALFKAEEKQQEIVVQSGPILFLLDEEKMRRVIGNLLSNAIKFSPIGGQIILKATEVANNLIITCEDFGLGVPEKEKELIFDMFTVAKKMGTNGEETFGMGLAICKQIVAAHGGQISCQPKTTYGAIFKIVLQN